MLGTMVRTLLAAVLLAAPLAGGRGVDTRLEGRDGLLCCGGRDCAATAWRARGGRYELLTREQRRVSIPEDRIALLPVPGDPPSGDSHHAHLCYRPALDADRIGGGGAKLFDGIYLVCAFIPPGAI